MKKRIGIMGMRCANCARHVETALAGVSGVENVVVDLPGGSVRVDIDGSVSDAALLTAIGEAGYGVDGISDL